MKKSIYLFFTIFILSSSSIMAQEYAPEFTWTKRAGGVGQDRGMRCAIDKSGNIFITGEFRETADFGTYTLTSAGNADIYLAKYDKYGNLLWVRGAGGPDDSGYIFDGGVGVAVDKSGNCIISGQFWGTATFSDQTITSNGTDDGFIAKYDTDGNLLWVKQAGGEESGYLWNDLANGITTDSEDNILVTGTFTGSGVFDNTTLISAGSMDIFAAKYDRDGNLLWARRAGGTSLERGTSITVDISDNIILTGRFYQNIYFDSIHLPGFGGDEDIFVAKYDKYGNVLWAKQAGSQDIGVSSFDLGTGIDTDQYENIYVTGRFQSIATFETSQITSAGDYDIFVAKYDKDGNLLWVNQAGGIYEDWGILVVVDDFSNSYVSGFFTEAATFGSIQLTSIGYTDLFIAKYNVDGNVLWVKQAGGTDGYTAGSGINIDSLGNIALTGAFAGTATFNTNTISSLGDLDILITYLQSPYQPPVIDEITTPTDPTNVNTEIIASATFSDLNTDETHTATWDWGDGTTSEGTIVESGGTGTVTGTHTYSAPGVYIVILTVTDDYGRSVQVEFTIVIINNPPVINIAESFEVNEGASIEVFATASDPDGDPLSYNWDLDGDGVFETPGQNVIFSASELDGPSDYDISVQVTDDKDAAATDQTTIQVNNVPPTMGEITAPMEPIQAGTEISVSAIFSDPGIHDTHTATWDWEDETTSDGIVDETNGSGTVSGAHTYSIAGVYTITLTVTDDDGGSGHAIFQYIVIFDPSEGFVTGGGRFDSPEGAYIENPILTGPAQFGFNTKYVKGKSEPTRNTHFNFNVADLDFNSTNHEWLVIAGSKTMFKGTGTINGEGDYKFIVSAIDGAFKDDGDGLDKFRIKINGIYDNQMGDADDADATTVIKGNIIIHETGTFSKPAGSDDQDIQILTRIPNTYALMQNYPNPFNPITMIRFGIPTEENVTIEIFNSSGQRVSRLFTRKLNAGYHEVKWDASNMATGVYFYQITAGEFQDIKKMILMK